MQKYLLSVVAVSVFLVASERPGPPIPSRQAKAMPVRRSQRNWTEPSRSR